MKVIKQIADLRLHVEQAVKDGKTVGFVPTMGYLHEGHLSLMRLARDENDCVVASIFVNPLQFGPAEDYSVYPRDLARDCQMAETAGVDIIFAPSVVEMYPNGYDQMLSYVDVKKITERLCGQSRPGHFRGVATVVTKLFNIVGPHRAYFGQKDAQQVAVIRRMAEDLNIPVKIISAPIVREADGLALSSRNVFLNPAERQAATVLYKSLQQAKQMLDQGERDAEKIRGSMSKLIACEPLAATDYISVSDPDTLGELATISGKALVALAVRFGKTRLIDNLLWEE